jgi:hypothetical protein
VSFFKVEKIYFCFVMRLADRCHLNSVGV